MIINKKNETNLSGFYIVYKGSVNLEKKGWYGLSHLLEHLKCKCIDDLMDSFQEDGISWNAYTSINEIVFYFKGLEKYLAPYRKTIIERFSKPLEDYVSKEDLDKEKNIVLKEYNQAFNSPEEVFQNNFIRREFSCYLPIGLREDIENITYKDCLEFYDIQYKRPDLIINISKDFELKDENLKFDDRTYSLRNDWKNDETIPIEENITNEKTIEFFYTQLVDEEDYNYVGIINSMLSDGLNSPFYQEIRENKGLCYGIGSHIIEIGKTNFLLIDILTSPENEESLHKELNNILENKEKYLTSKRLEVIRKAYLIEREKSLINSHNNFQEYIDPKISKLYDLVEKISLEDIYKIYDKYFNIDKFKKTSNFDIK